MPSPQEPTGPSDDDLVGELPTFGPIDDPDERPSPDRPPPPAEETPPQTSSIPRPPPHEAPTTAGTSSSTGSSERAITVEDLTDALGDIAGVVFQSAGAWLNRRENRRRHRVTTRWLATQEELEAFGSLSERYLIKQVPESVTGSEEATTAVAGGLIVTGYVVRNLFAGDEAPPSPVSVDPAERARAAQAAAPPPTPPAPAPSAPPPAPAAVHADTTGLSRAEAPPIDVISPGI